LFSERNQMFLAGTAFLTLLVLSYFANLVFFEALNVLFQNELLVFMMIFIHNIIVVSLILLGMTFYVKLVESGLFKREKHPNVMLEHPKIFAIIFAVMILLLGILRGTNLIFGSIVIELLPLIILISTPIGIVEGYGIYVTINKTLSRTIVTNDLIRIYGIFLFAAVIEVGLAIVLR
jgi:hypothetical protein